MGVPTTSPVFSGQGEKAEAKGVDFYTALRAVVEQDKKITREEWEDDGWYGFMHEEILALHEPDGTLHSWLVSLGDLVGTDWHIID